MRNIRNILTIMVGVAAILMLSSIATGQSQKALSTARAVTGTQQPLYSEYRGVRLGMTATEARAKLGEPALKADDQDYYVFSEKETAQLVYDKDHKVMAISTDYIDGIGAPDPRTVVGGDLETREDGSHYKIVRYESLGFWVSYNRHVGALTVVTITIQKALKG